LPFPLPTRPVGVTSGGNRFTRLVLILPIKKGRTRAKLVLPYGRAVTGDEGLGGTSKLYATVAADVVPSVAPPKIVAHLGRPIQSDHVCLPFRVAAVCPPWLDRYAHLPNRSAMARSCPAANALGCAPSSARTARQLFPARLCLRRRNAMEPSDSHPSRPPRQFGRDIPSQTPQPDTRRARLHINSTTLCAVASPCQARFFPHHILWPARLFVEP
jgi:hypothetical protein